MKHKIIKFIVGVKRTVHSSKTSGVNQAVLLYLTSKELLAVASTTAHFFVSLGLPSGLMAQVC